MESLNTQEIRVIVEMTLTKPAGGYSIGNLKHTLIKSDDHNRFLVIRTGWYNNKDYYGVMQDVELRDSMVFIHRDGADEELAEELIEAGIPVASIVKAYLSPELN